jgi:polysaccharide export outer membrane protein
MRSGAGNFIFMSAWNFVFKHKWCGLLSVICLLFAGCETPPQNGSAPIDYGINSTPDQSILLREGDGIRLTFPGASQLDSQQAIRRDGKIALSGFGEIQAVGLTPAQLEKQILEKFGKDLVTKEVSVTLLSSAYPVFVNGAVLHPGKIEATRPITALEAIMEAGGFDYAKANVKSVKVIRTEGAEVKTFMLDFRKVLQGQPTPPFYVRPSDIIFVPEKFTLF